MKTRRLNLSVFLLPFLILGRTVAVMLRKFGFVACSVWLVTAASFAAPPQGARPLVKIGAIVPLTGSLSHAGAAFRDAMRLAIEEIPGGSKFEYQLLIEDDGLKPSQVATVANKLINLEHVDALVSTWSYGGAIVAPLAERAEVIHFGVAWDPAVAKGRFNFIHLAPPKAFLPVFLEIFERFGYRRIAVVGMIESGSEHCMNELERLIRGTPFVLLERATMNYGDLDFRTILTRMERKRPQVYFTNFGTSENDVFMKQAKEMKIRTPITAITGFDVSEDLSLLEGRWYVSDSIMPDDFAARFSAKYGHSRLYGVGNFYDAVRLIVDRYESSTGAGKPAPAALLAQFNDLSGFQSVFGALTIDQDGIISYPVQCRTISSGVRRRVNCADIKPAPW